MIPETFLKGNSSQTAQHCADVSVQHQQWLHGYFLSNEITGPKKKHCQSRALSLLAQLFPLPPAHSLFQHAYSEIILMTHRV